MCGFFSRIFGFFSSKKDETEDISYTEPVQPKQEPSQTQLRRERPKSAKIPRTRETQAYVESIKKKAFSPETSAKPFVDKTDPQRIGDIAKRIKEKF